MNRKVLIIKGHSKNEEELKYDREIIELYRKYFRSRAGGVYNTDEVFILEEPSLEDIRSHDSEIENCDSLIVVLLGHGANIDKKQVFQLQKDLMIYPGQLNYSVRIQLFIIESCRNILDAAIEVEDLNGLIPKYKHGGTIKACKTEEEAKLSYNDALKNTEDGITFLFAASINESAINYYFIHQLIKVSRYYHEYTTIHKVYDIERIFNDTANEVKKLTEDKQNPLMEGNNKFPFVISII